MKITDKMRLDKIVKSGKALRKAVKAAIKRDLAAIRAERKA